MRLKIDDVRKKKTETYMMCFTQKGEGRTQGSTPSEYSCTGNMYFQFGESTVVSHAKLTKV